MFSRRLSAPEFWLRSAAPAKHTRGRGAERRQYPATPVVRRGPAALADRARASGAPDASPLGAPLRRFLFPGPRFTLPLHRSARHVGLYGLGVVAPAAPVGSSPGRALGRERVCNGGLLAGSLRRGRSAPRLGPETSRVRGYEPRPRAPPQPSRLNRRSGPMRAAPYLQRRPSPLLRLWDRLRRRPSSSKVEEFRHRGKKSARWF